MTRVLGNVAGRPVNVYSFSYMATAGGDARMKIWDLRTYKCMHEYLNFKGAASALDFSQRGLLATGHGSIVEVKNFRNFPGIFLKSIGMEGYYIWRKAYRTIYETSNEWSYC